MPCFWQLCTCTGFFISFLVHTSIVSVDYDDVLIDEFQMQQHMQQTDFDHFMVSEVWPLVFDSLRSWEHEKYWYYCFYAWIDIQVLNKNSIAIVFQKFRNALLQNIDTIISIIDIFGVGYYETIDYPQWWTKHCIVNWIPFNCKILLLHRLIFQCLKNLSFEYNDASHYRYKVIIWNA